MLYHLNTPQRANAMEEFKRVLKPDGVLVVATSGADNKLMHRVYEKLIARSFDQNVTPPPPMNAGFTTKDAALELPAHFSSSYLYHQAVDMLIGPDNESVDAYLQSLRSLRDQFSPEPSELDYDTVLEQKVLPIISAHIKRHGVLRDTIRRSVFIASNSTPAFCHQEWNWTR